MLWFILSIVPIGAKGARVNIISSDGWRLQSDVVVVVGGGGGVESVMSTGWDLLEAWLQ